MSLFACSPGSRAISSPNVIVGTIDLRGWDFIKNGSVKLEGEWEFYRNSILTPSEFKQDAAKNKPGFIQIPGMWNKTAVNNSLLPGKGYATYRLNIILRPDKKPKTFSFSHVYSAYKIFINGVLLDSVGLKKNAKKAMDNYVFIFDKRKYSFSPIDGKNEIIIQVFNSEYASGGINGLVRLEDGEMAAKNDLLTYTINIMIAGILVFAAVYNILFYFFRRKERTSLLLGLFCFIWGLNTYNLESPLFTGYLPHFGNSFLISYITVILGMALCMMIARSMYPDDISIYVIKLTQISACLVIPPLFFVSIGTADLIINSFFALCIIFALYAEFAIIKAAIKRRKDSGIFLIGLSAMLAAGINSALHAMRIVNTGNMMHYAMIVFSLISTVIISRKMTKALDEVEIMSAELRNVRKSGFTDIAVRTRNGTYSLTLSEIIYITAHSKTITVHMEERDIEVPMLMKNITDKLPSGMFVRIHKSHIINIRYIHSISHVLSGRYRVRLKDNDETKLPVGAAFLEALREKIQN